MELHEATATASDFQGNDILDQNNNPVRIMNVPAYQAKLGESQNFKPWWTGRFTTMNGYYFTDEGSNYCASGTKLGETAGIRPLERGADGQAVARDEITSVILCPSSFDTSPRPNSYREANNLLAKDTNLADGVPKSATLLHEMFHAIRGDVFLSGDIEKRG